MVSLDLTGEELMGWALILMCAPVLLFGAVQLISVLSSGAPRAQIAPISKTIAFEAVGRALQARNEPQNDRRYLVLSR